MGLNDPFAGALDREQEVNEVVEIDRRGKLMTKLITGSVITLVLGMIAEDVPVVKEVLITLAVILMAAGIWQLIKLDRLQDKSSAG